MCRPAVKWAVQAGRALALDVVMLPGVHVAPLDNVYDLECLNAAATQACVES